jgi:hypothetical protein
MSHRALGQQFKAKLQAKAEDYITRKMAPIHQAIIRQGEANQPAIDEAMAHWNEAIFGK